MTAHRIINILLFCGIVAAYGFVMDSDYSAEMAESQSLMDAQRQAQRELKRDMAAAKQCRETHGNAGYVWTESGELVCVPRKPLFLARAQ